MRNLAIVIVVAAVALAWILLRPSDIAPPASTQPPHMASSRVGGEGDGDENRREPQEPAVPEALPRDAGESGSKPDLVEFSGILVDQDGNAVTNVGMFISSSLDSIVGRVVADRVKRFVQPDSAGRFSTQVDRSLVGPLVSVGVYERTLNASLYQGYLPLGTGHVIEVLGLKSSKRPSIKGIIRVAGAYVPDNDCVNVDGEKGQEIGVQLGCSGRELAIDVPQLWLGAGSYSGPVTLSIQQGSHTGMSYFERRFDSWDSCAQTLAKGIDVLVHRLMVTLPPLGDASKPDRAFVETATPFIGGYLEARPDDEGRIALRVADGDYAVKGVDADARTWGLGYVSIRSGVVSSPLAWKLTGPGVEHASMVVVRNGHPVPGLSVRVFAEAADALAWTWVAEVEGLTDEEGKAVLTGLSPGRYRLEVADQHGTLLAQVNAQVPGPPIMVNLEPRGCVALRLSMDDQKSLGRNAKVGFMNSITGSVSWRDIGMDSPRHMAVDQVGVGAHEILVVADRHSGLGSIQILEGQTHVADIMLSARGGVSGRVLAASGVPCGGLSVELTVSRWERVVSRCKTDEDGRFSLLGAAGTCRLVIKKGDETQLSREGIVSGAFLGDLVLP